MMISKGTTISNAAYAVGYEGLPNSRANVAARSAHRPRRMFGRSGQPRDVTHTPTSVTASPAKIATLNGSENNIQAHSMVTGGLR
jgi:hypothetical protein